MGELPSVLLPFVPWVLAAPDTIRLHLARAPDAVLMTLPRSFGRLAEASGVRLRLAGPAAPPPREAPVPTGPR